MLNTGSLDISDQPETDWSGKIHGIWLLVGLILLPEITRYPVRFYLRKIPAYSPCQLNQFLRVKLLILLFFIISKNFF